MTYPVELSLVLVSSKSFLAKIVQKFTKSEWSHAAIIFGMIKDKFILVSEAAWHGVSTAPLETYAKKEYKLKIVKLPLKYIYAGLCECVDAQVKKTPYGYGQFIGMAPVTTLHIKNPLKHGRICSEHALVVLAEAGYDKFIELIEGKKKDSISPGHLDKIVSSDTRCVVVGRKDFDQEIINWER